MNGHWYAEALREQLEAARAEIAQLKAERDAATARADSLAHFIATTRAGQPLTLG